MSASRSALNTLRTASRLRVASSTSSCRRALSTMQAGVPRGSLIGHNSRRALARSRRTPSLVRTMFIQTEPTPNEDSLKFIPGVDVMGSTAAPGESTTAEFLDTRSALISPLALRLMGIEGVTHVFYGPDFVTVSKSSEHPWAVLKPEIYSILMEHFTSNTPLFRSDEDRAAAGPQDLRISDDDSEIVAMIKELLETRVRPAIMEDGGDIEYRGFDEDSGVVRLRLKGSCRGCSSSAITLKSGIERMLMHYVPEVKEVEQVIDEEEAVALDEFAKFEARLAEKEKKRGTSGLEQYASI